MRLWLIVMGVLTCAVFFTVSAAQPSRLLWQKTYFGTSNDYANCVAVAQDGGYLVAGTSRSGEGLDKDTPNYGWDDGWVIRLDSRGNKLWEGNFGGTGADQFWDVKPTLDGGWILVARSASAPSGNKTSPTFGGDHYWVVRLDDSGNKLWEKSFGGGYIFDSPRSILALPDGGFLVGGISQSNTNEVKTVPQFGAEPRGDIWILRLDQHGEILWQRAYGGDNGDGFAGFEACGTNGYIIAGWSLSAAGTGNKESPLYGESDFWILFVDLDGNKIWERSYGGGQTDEPLRIRCTSDGGSIVCGWTRSGVSGNKSTPLLGGGFDTWIIRLDANGEKLWERTIGTSLTDVPWAVVQTLEGGFVMSGVSNWEDAWLVRLDSVGSTIWERRFGVQSSIRSLYDLQNTSDGGTIAGGSRLDPATGSDLLMMKFGPDALTAPQLQLFRETQRLVLSGIAGRTYVTEATADFIEWQPFQTNTLTSNSISIAAEFTTPAKRFYRARLSP